MIIKNLKVENVRGIDQLSIDSNIYKNRPNILVAPNGFGKTSIAMAFKCAAEQTSIKLENEDRYHHDGNKKATIELELDENGSSSKLSVTEQAHSNNIRKHFDIHVVSDRRRIKAYSRNVGAFTKSRMVIDPIVICKKVKFAKSPYRISEIERDFGKHKKALPNINDSLFKSHDFVMRSPECWKYVDELIKTRKWNKIENVRKQLSDYSGSTDDGLSHVEKAVNDLFVNTPEAKGLFSIIEATTKLCGVVKAFLSIWQMLTLAKRKSGRDALKSYLEWLRYSKIKKSLSDGLKDLNTSWKIPCLKVTKGNMVVEMPYPTHISNGQRDVLLLFSLLYIARYNLVKSRAILVVDEVFDYLDDANLTVAQYYISQLIEDYKRQGRSIYTIILTHLNPSFFGTYVFSKQNTIYLGNGFAHDSIDAMKRLIGARSQNVCDKALKKKISKYLVHFYRGEYDFAENLKSIKGIRLSWGKNGKFQGFLRDEFCKYRSGQPYDPLAICAVTRRSIEELAFNQISDEPDANEFFNTHKTKPKLDWAVQRKAVVPETHYLLRVIFDDGLHWNPDRDNTIPIVAKLANPIIKKMIVEIVSACMKDL